MKEAVCQAIDRRRDEIVGAGEAIMDQPELGFKEWQTADKVCAVFSHLGLSFENQLALTGVKARLNGGGDGPTVALMGELDALVVPDHPRANRQTGAAHACGHNAQIAGLLGAAYGLVESGVADALGGNVVFFAVPAEEYVEIEYRMDLVRQGKTTFLAGKPELVQLGHFDDVDMAIMIHSSSPDHAEGSMGVAASSNGFLAKSIAFHGRAAHAGGSPEKGVNALSAAQLALSAINAQRETFRDQDCVRVHPIITKGGDLVNIIPSEVRMETYVRARTQEAILDAEAKVDRALKGAAMAMGCRVAIETVPGYLPLRNSARLRDMFKENSERVFGADQYRDYPHGGGSTDAGDLSQIMPVLHPAMTGALGAIHSSEWHIADVDAGYLAPAKTMAMMVVDLLSDGRAQEILAAEKPALSKEEYLAMQRGIFRSEHYDPQAGAA